MQLSGVNPLRPPKSAPAAETASVQVVHHGLTAMAAAGASQPPSPTVLLDQMVDGYQNGSDLALIDSTNFTTWAMSRTKTKHVAVRIIPRTREENVRSTRTQSQELFDASDCGASVSYDNRMGIEGPSQCFIY